MTEPARRDGHAFLLALTGAIAAASDTLPDAAFAYRGADLRAAVERALFVALSNDAALVEAFAAGTRLRRGTALEAAVARALLGDDRVAAPGRLRRARLARAERRLLGAGTPPATPAPGWDAEPGGVWFALDHAKFLPLVEPVAQELGQQQPAVLWTASSVRPAGRREPALDEVPTAASDARAAGRALQGHVGLLRDVDRAEAAFERFGVERLVVVEGNSPHDAVAAAVAARAGIPVTCMQNGWSPVVHAGFRRMPFQRMCVWGEGFGELLAPHSAGVDFAATGHPTLGAAAAAGPMNATLAERVADRPAVSCFLQPCSPYIEPRDNDAMLALVDAVAEAAPEAAVVVREHPGHPVGARAWPANVVLANAPDVPLLDVILAARAVTSIYSTSLLEGAALGRPAVALNPTSLPRLSPDLEAEGAGVETARVDDACATLVELLTSDTAIERRAPGMARVRDRYFSGLPADAPARTARAIATT